MENEEIKEEVEQQETVEQAKESNTANDSVEAYKAIIEQQNQTIKERDERIDKLINQMQGLVNNHGNYKEESNQQYKPIEQAPKPDDYEPLSSLDFSI